MTHNLPDTGIRDQRLVEGVVSNLPIFLGIAPSHLRAISRQCWAMRAHRGLPLIRAGARLPGVFALAYGCVKLSLRNGGSAERVLRLVAARQTFGEASALLGRGSPYDAMALSESKLVIIPTAAVHALIERDARFTRGLVLSLAERQLELCAEMESATLQSGAQRLAGYLHELAGGGSPPSACTVQLPFSKTLVAARLGMKKETLSRLLRQFAKGGIIGVRRREIAIYDRERLIAAAHLPR